MKSTILKTIILLAINYSTVAQVGIGTSAPRAALDINATNAGLLTPQVALTQTTDATTVKNLQTNGIPVDGTIIWNTATAGTTPLNVTPGYYYWETNKWIRIGTQLTKDAKTQASTTTLSGVTSTGTTCGTLAQAAINNTSFNIDDETRVVNIPVSGITGNICNITVNVNLNKNGWTSEIDLYLISPTNKIIELCTDNGSSGSANTTFNVTFSDAGTTNITSWTTNTSISGTYRPEGTLTTDGYTPTITTLAGFSGDTPNGNWNLIVRDDASGNNIVFNSVTRKIATFLPANYKLVAQRQINTLNNKNIIASSSYSVNTAENVVQTIITRSTTNITTTSSATLPTGTTIVSVATQNKAPQLAWVNNNNQAIDEALTNSTNYYYQLWVLGAPTTTTQNNEQYNFIVRTDDKPTN